MARGINKVILVGNLGNDPDVKYTQGGMAVVKVSLATTSVRKNRDGETMERTEWHRVTFFGKLGEIVAEYLTKGSQIYVEGSIRYDKYTDSNDIERYTTDIIADEMQMLGGGQRREGGDGGNGGGERRQPAQRSTGTGTAQQPRQGGGQRQPSTATDYGADFADDDIPF